MSVLRVAVSGLQRARTGDHKAGRDEAVVQASLLPLTASGRDHQWASSARLPLAQVHFGQCTDIRLAVLLPPPSRAPSLSPLRVEVC